MKKNNVYLYESDVFRIVLYNKDEALNMFYYQDEDLTHYVDQDLINEYYTIETKYKELQNKLYKIYRNKYEK